MNRDVKIGLAIGLLLLVGLFVVFAYRASRTSPEVADLPGDQADQTLGPDHTASSADNATAPSASDFFAADNAAVSTAGAGNTATVEMGTTGAKSGADLKGDAYKFADLLGNNGPSNPTSSGSVAGTATGTATPPVNETAPAAPSTYVVKKGDYLSTISRNVYGTARHWEKIAQANNITDARTLRPGMTLKIPALTDAERGTTATTRTTAPAAGFGATATTGGERTHKVASGDTLSDISKKYYGSQKYVKMIMEANKLTDARMLRVGSTLVIPSLPSSTPVATPSAPVVSPEVTPMAIAPAPASGSREYVVRQGDTLQGISRKFYGSTKHYLVIMQANNLDDPRAVRIGSKLVIPAKPEFGASAPATAVVPVVAISADPSMAPGERLYTVREGDTFAIVAATELGSSLYRDDIMKRNHLTDADALRPGQVLVLPARAALNTLTSVTRDE